MDFLKYTSEKIGSLSEMERGLFNFTVRNLHLAKTMSVRDFACANFVSTSTTLRYVKKLGFEGWTDFQLSVRESEEQSRKLVLPGVLRRENYCDSYLKNIIEAVKIISDEKAEMFDRIMNRYPKIYILGSGMSEEVGLYIYRLLKVIGYDAEFPRSDYEFDSVVRRIKREDVLLVLSFSGNNRDIVGQIENIFSVATPTIVSITRSDNNIIQNMSDLNFYVFADELCFGGLDVTSRCGMIAILEVLLYKQMTKGTYSMQAKKPEKIAPDASSGKE